MDINLLDKNTLKIKLKKTNFVIDPKEKTPKTSADIVIAIDRENFDKTRVTDYRVIIKGPGEYEIGGIKLIGYKYNNEFTSYSFITNNTSVLVGKVSSLEKILDKIEEHKIAILDVDEKINPSIVTAIEPNCLILYGEMAKEGVESLGKEALEKKTEQSQKFTINEDKLSEEMQIIVLE